MNTDQIAYLIDIAKTGSINTTAKRMFSSQQAVSESIKRLEHELNCTILDRSKRGVSLTEDGKFVLEHIIPMMEQYQILQHHFQECALPNGKLNIGVTPFVANTILPDIIFKMYRLYPDITMYTKEIWIDEIYNQLLNKERDFGIMNLSDDSQFSLRQAQTVYQDTLIIQLLYEDHMVCVMHKNNPLATQKKSQLIKSWKQNKPSIIFHLLSTISFICIFLTIQQFTKNLCKKKTAFVS